MGGSSKDKSIRKTEVCISPSLQMKEWMKLECGLTILSDCQWPLSTSGRLYCSLM